MFFFFIWEMPFLNFGGNKNKYCNLSDMNFFIKIWKIFKIGTRIRINFGPGSGSTITERWIRNAALQALRKCVKQTSFCPSPLWLRPVKKIKKATLSYWNRHKKEGLFYGVWIRDPVFSWIGSFSEKKNHGSGSCLSWVVGSGYIS